MPLGRVFDASEVLNRTVLTVVIDPNAPKRGLSAYMFFANEQRQSVRDDNPDVTFGKWQMSVLQACLC